MYAAPCCVRIPYCARCCAFCMVLTCVRRACCEFICLSVLFVLCHDAHVRLLALFRDDCPALPSFAVEDPSGPLLQRIQRRAAQAQEMRRQLEGGPRVRARERQLGLHAAPSGKNSMRPSVLFSVLQCRFLDRYRALCARPDKTGFASDLQFFV